MRYCRDHRYFAVREVAVQGTKQLSVSRVRMWLRMVEGMSIWRASPRVLEDELLKHPQVADASVRRVFPDRLEVTVTEREARAVLRDARGLFLIDDEGIAFEVAAPEAALPVVTVAPEEVGPAAGPGDASDLSPRVLREAVQVTGLLEGGAGGIGVSEVLLRPGGRQNDLTVFSKDGRLVVQLGWGRWSEKLESLSRIIARARQSGEADAADGSGLAGSIDARDPEVLVARWTPQGTA